MTSAIDQATIPLLPTKDTALRLRHFDSNVYDLTESSGLYSYVDALVGDAGVGSLKKQLLINRLNQSIDTTHFDDLDNTFGNIFKIARLASETYTYSPETDLLTTAQWSEVHVKDAWYRARVKTFFTALGLGGTPDGLRLMVKAALGVDSEIYEMWRFQDNYAAIYGISDIETIQNLISTPSAEYGVSLFNIPGGTTLSTTTTVPAAVFSGTQAYLWTTGGTNPDLFFPAVPVSGGKQYTLSFYAYRPSGTTYTNIKGAIQQNNGSTTISTTATTAGTSTALSSAVLTRVSYTFTTDVNATSIYPAVEWVGTASAGQVGYIDAVMLQATATPQPYFDGDTSGYRWMGQPGASASIKASPIDALSRTRVPSRNEVIIYPHKSSISTLEMIQTKTMLRRLAPVDSIMTVANSGYGINVPLPIFSVKADSTFFQVQQYVTGAPGTDLSVTEEPNQSYRWLSSTQEKLAPGAAFNQPQEYSQYYLYSTNPSSAIDSVWYSSQDSHGTIFGELPYQTVSEAPNIWGPWIVFDKADSPDNYPGGKLGHAPTLTPAVTAKAPYKAYVFPYKSQADYVAKMKVQITAAGGQVQGTSQYRLPIAGKISTQITWTPDLAMEVVEPNKLSAVTAGWYDRSPY